MVERIEKIEFLYIKRGEFYEIESEYSVNKNITKRGLKVKF